MKRLLLPLVAATALAGTGCYTRGDVGVGYSYGYATAGPDLYYLGPGVSVVAYSDYPTFYADNYYWMYSNGVWYSSSYYGGGWAVSYNVPYHVRSIRNPRGYTRFTPGTGWTRVSGRGSYNPRGYNARGNANNPPPGAYAAPRGGRPYSSGGYQAPAGRNKSGRSTYTPPARSNGGVTTTPRGRSSGPTVRDHRRR